jgi:hypothetical protein
MAAEEYGELAAFRPDAPQPIIGEPHALVLLARFLRNPLDVWADFQFEINRHTFRYFGIQATLLNDPADIHEVFVRQADKLRHETIRQRMTKPLLGNGVLTAEDEAWRSGRRLFAQALAPEHTIASAPAIDANVQRFLARRIGDGASIRGLDLTGEMMMSVLSEVMYSGALDTRLIRINSDIEGYFRTFGRATLRDLFGLPGWVPSLGKIGGFWYKRRLKALARRLVSERLALNMSAPSDGVQAILDEAVRQKLPREIMEDNVLTLVLTGSETLPKSLAWTLFLLARAQDAQDRARAEIGDADLAGIDPSDWAERLPFLMACYEEALRLYPPGPIIPRQVVAPIKLGDEVLEEGSVVFINTWILHRHRLLWREPDAFRPERFLDGERESMHKLAFLPFGVGHRACIGARFATIQAAIALTRILTAYRVSYTAARDPEPMLNVTLRPGNGAPLRLTPLG